MATEEQIREGFKGWAKMLGPAVTNIAEVKSVDEGKAICILIDEDGQDIPDVRLRPVLSGQKSFLQVPKVGTKVLAVRVEDDDDWMVIACDEIEKISYTVGSSLFEIEEKFKIKAGGKSLATVLQNLLNVIEIGYQTNSGATIQLIQLTEFLEVKNDLQQIFEQ